MDADQFDTLKRTITPFKMEVVVTLADLKSITRTAETMGLTRPTVSLILSRIEKNSQVKIFAKRAQTFALSEEGEALVALFIQILEMFDDVWAPDRKKQRTFRPDQDVPRPTLAKRPLE